MFKRNHIKAITCFVFAFIAQAPCHAGLLTYRAQDVVFSDGTKLLGTLTFDSLTQSLERYSIRTQTGYSFPGSPPFLGHTYDNATAGAATEGFGWELRDYSTGQFIYMGFLEPIGPTYKYIFGDSFEYCANSCLGSSSRNIVTGVFVLEEVAAKIPEPSTYWLVMMGLFMSAHAIRLRKFSGNCFALRQN